MAGTRKLGKPTDQRLAMLKCLTTDLILNGKVVTTEARAKEVKVVKAKLDSKGRKVTEKVQAKMEKNI